MPKGYEDFKGDKKKAKFTLMEKRQRKKEKKMRQQQSSQLPEHPDVTI
jgi:hypothetical protein